MAALCKNCGEELMGAVNRCWKCGLACEVSTHTPPSPAETAPPSSEASNDHIAASEAQTAPRTSASRAGQPPTRVDRPPAADEPVVVAEAVTAHASDEHGQGDGGANLGAPATGPAARSPFDDSRHEAANRGAVHVGSPFAPVVDRRPLPATYPQHAAAEGGAIASVVLGCMSLAFCFILPAGAVITSLIGLGMGSWGCYSKRRATSVVGMVLCCLALAIGGFNLVVEIYTYFSGVTPAAPGI